MSKQYNKIYNLGSGTYAMVYKAVDLKTNQNVALKKFVNKIDMTNGISEVTIREISLLKMFNHPNIIKLLSYDNTKFGYITMPIYDSTLKQHITDDKLDIKNISYQLCSGLYYLHSYGVAHRDLKPQNILISSSNEVKIIDFGISRQLDLCDRTEPKTPTVCTLWYRSPDVLLGYKDYHYELDVWSLGCIIGEMMLKKPMFPGDSDIDQLYKIFKVFGTPNENSWEGVSLLPYYKTCFPQWVSTFETTYENHDPILIDLIKTILIMNPTNRPKINTVIEHPYFGNHVKNIKENWMDIMTKWEMAGIHLYDNNITTTMRNILLDWLLEVSSQYNVSTKAYIRARSILDRLNYENIDRTKYQLLGGAALWIGSKIEDPYVLSSGDLIYISDNAYDCEELVNMESEILRELDMDLYFPIVSMFLSSYKDEMDLTETQVSEIEFVMLYIGFNLKLMKYHPSVQCLCACLFVTNQTDMVKENDEVGNCMKEMETWLRNGFDKNIGKFTSIKNWNHNLDLSRYH